MGSVLSLAFSAIIIQNVILSKFLGICPFLGVSKSKKSAVGMGVAVVFVAQAFGINLGLNDYLTVILTATLASIDTAGVTVVGDHTKARNTSSTYGSKCLCKY